MRTSIIILNDLYRSIQNEYILKHPDMLKCEIRLTSTMFGRLWLDPPWPIWGFYLALIVYDVRVIHCPAS